jgi:hypothetical protein
MWPETDVATLNLPRYVAERPKISHLFVDLRDAEREFNQVKLITWKELEENILYDMRDVNQFTRGSFNARDTVGNLFKVVNGFHGECMTRDGECGGVYVAYDSKANRKLLGIHTAYHHTKGACGAWVTEERWKEHKFPESPLDIPTVEPALTQCFVQDVPFGPEIAQDLNVLGLSEKAQLIPQESKIVPSLVHQELTPFVSLPALLTDTVVEKRDGNVVLVQPLKKAVRKWARKPHKMPADGKEVMMEIIANLPFEWGKPDNTFKSVESDDIAINGKEGTAMEPIEVKTSAGIPYTEMPHKLGGKKDHLIKDSDEGERLHYHPSTFLEDRLKMREEMAKNGIRFETRWGDCLKDERRLLEKIEEGSTRLFCVGPLDYTICCRKYFMRFANHCIMNRHRLPMQIGVNPDGSEWRTLWLRLNRRARRSGVNFIAGDFSNFDMSLLIALTEGVGEAIIEWFKMCGSTEEETRVRRVLLQEIYRSIRVNGRVVYECLQGVPSGHFLTALFNSILNYVIVKTCVFYNARKKGITMNHEIFAELYDCAMVGDDHIVAQDEEIDWFDQQVLQETIAYIFGMGYTDSTKAAKVAKFTKRDELTFLKRYFREEAGYVFAPLMEYVLEEEINWIRKNDDDEKTATWKNMDASLRGYMHWGRTKFEFKKTQYNYLAFKFGIPPFPLKFEVLLEEWKRR